MNEEQTDLPVEEAAAPGSTMTAVMEEEPKAETLTEDTTESSDSDTSSDSDAPGDFSRIERLRHIQRF